MDVHASCRRWESLEFMHQQQHRKDLHINIIPTNLAKDQEQRAEQVKRWRRELAEGSGMPAR